MYVDHIVVSLRCPPSCSMVELWKSAETQYLSTVWRASDPCPRIGLFQSSSSVRTWNSTTLSLWILDLPYDLWIIHSHMHIPTYHTVTKKDVHTHIYICVRRRKHTYVHMYGRTNPHWCTYIPMHSHRQIDTHTYFQNTSCVSTVSEILYHD